MAGMILAVVDVKGAFLHGDIEDNKEIHKEVLKGFEKHYDDGVVLTLRRCLYGLQQAVEVFCKQLLKNIRDDALKFTQPVIFQNYTDEFELPNLNFPTPATAGDCLTKCKEKDALGPAQHTKYRVGVGKMMNVMQYSLSQTYNAVRDLARHMSQPAPKHMKAMLHCTKHCADRPNRGLVLKPDTKWDGSKVFAFTIAGRSDSDYAKEPITRRSVSVSSVKLN